MKISTLNYYFSLSPVLKLLFCQIFLKFENNKNFLVHGILIVNIFWLEGVCQKCKTLTIYFSISSNMNKYGFRQNFFLGLLKRPSSWTFFFHKSLFHPQMTPKTHKKIFYMKNLGKMTFFLRVAGSQPL